MDYPKNWEELDFYDLNTELARQPKICRDVWERLANADQIEKKAKKDLLFIEAKLSIAIRKNPKDFGFDGKVTESVIDHLIKLQPEYQKAEEEYIQAAHYTNLMRRDTKAVEDRKEALRGLITLFLKNYYAEPIAPTEYARELEEKQGRETTKEIEDALNEEAEEIEHKFKKLVRRKEKQHAYG